MNLFLRGVFITRAWWSWGRDGLPLILNTGPEKAGK